MPCSLLNTMPTLFLILRLCSMYGCYYVVIMQFSFRSTHDHIIMGFSLSSFFFLPGCEPKCLAHMLPSLTYIIFADFLDLPSHTAVLNAHLPIFTALPSVIPWCVIFLYNNKCSKSGFLCYFFPCGSWHRYSIEDSGFTMTDHTLGRNAHVASRCSLALFQSSAQVLKISLPSELHSIK